MLTKPGAQMIHYPVLPLRDIVVFPHMIVPLFVGRARSLAALERAMNKDKHLLMVTQHEPNENNPSPDELYRVGTIGEVLQLLKMSDDTVKLLIEGKQRAYVERFADDDDCIQATISLRDKAHDDNEKTKIAARALVSQFERYARLQANKMPPEVVEAIEQITDVEHLVDAIIVHVSLKIAQKQQILETLDINERIETLFSFIESEIEVMKTERHIRGRVKQQIEKNQREYYLNEQLKAIQKELGDGENPREEIAELEERIEKTKLSKEACDKAQAELKKLKSMSPLSPEATVLRNYLDWLLDVPWQVKSAVKHDLKQAEQVLDQDHYALEKVKERILEYLAVQQRTGQSQGTILCLVGPPGVGKTSLGASVARATGRNFVRVALGGVRDEAEIRGHRRTYIGSMPGKIIQSMKKAKTVNPLFLLDEVDKLGQDWRGDPVSALLEVLDSAQNSTFTDHYLEVEYDLSQVFFICTANTTDMPSPLLDRLEVIRLSGYTEEEKSEIAYRHLLPKQVETHGLTKGEFAITKSAMADLIRFYTREAGVRNLEREIANLARKAVRHIEGKTAEYLHINRRNLHKYAGVRRHPEPKANLSDRIGYTNGLAWTSSGGVLLPIEAVTLYGRGNIKTTGKLGEVMKESIQAAESYVKSRCLELGITPPTFAKRDIHIHIPEGATPKDGPSAGIAVVSAIVSVLSGIAVKGSIAMTGEMTLSGRILPVGGIKEKLLAAINGGIRKVLLPSGNQQDLAEIADAIKQRLDIALVEDIDDVLAHVLVSAPISVEWHDNDPELSTPPINLDGESDKNIRHH